MQLLLPKIHREHIEQELVNINNKSVEKLTDSGIKAFIIGGQI